MWQSSDGGTTTGGRTTGINELTLVVDDGSNDATASPARLVYSSRHDLDNYILPGKEDHDRLRTISDLHDERTHTLLRRAGFAPGCRFA